MQTINIQTIEALKADGLFYAAGALSYQLNAGGNYGCHYGMKSTRLAAAQEFGRGYSDAQLASASRVHAARSERTAKY